MTQVTLLRACYSVLTVLAASSSCRHGFCALFCLSVINSTQRFVAAVRTLRLVSLVAISLTESNAVPLIHKYIFPVVGKKKMNAEIVNTVVKLLYDRQAGASSMWASCCGLLNEVMGTGAVRGQQPGFGADAGPFRFAPSAGYSTYPSTSSGSPGLVCKACGQAFSVFRRKVCIWMFGVFPVCTVLPT